MQLWNIAKKRATTVAEAYTPTILADDLNELVGEAGEAITQEDREAIRDAFVETMADLQGKESKTASIITAPIAPETIETPTPEVSEFSGDTRDTNRKRGKPTSAAERRKAVKEARAVEKVQESQDDGDLGTPVNSIELFPAKDTETNSKGNTEVQDKFNKGDKVKVNIGNSPVNGTIESENRDGSYKIIKEDGGVISAPIKMLSKIGTDNNREDTDSSPATDASKSNRSTQATHIPLTPTEQGLDNSKALDNSIAEENKSTNKETA